MSRLEKGADMKLIVMKAGKGMLEAGKKRYICKVEKVPFSPDIRSWVTSIHRKDAQWYQNKRAEELAAKLRKESVLEGTEIILEEAT